MRFFSSVTKIPLPQDYQLVTTSSLRCWMAKWRNACPNESVIGWFVVHPSSLPLTLTMHSLSACCQLVHQILCHVVPCLCDNAFKRSPAIVWVRLSLFSLLVLNRDVNMIQTSSYNALWNHCVFVDVQMPIISFHTGMLHQLLWVMYMKAWSSYCRWLGVTWIMS